VVVHFLWQVKADAREALVFTTIYVALMLFRVPWSRLISRLGKTVHEGGGAPTPTPTSGR
ncbi:MAG: hypothetical protein R3223_08480, partial [Longimicrobiales bacterium]|nr:hypothetical protein [Longimicrobiales bacterium]